MGGRVCVVSHTAGVGEDESDDDDANRGAAKAPAGISVEHMAMNPDSASRDLEEVDLGKRYG